MFKSSIWFRKPNQSAKKNLIWNIVINQTPTERGKLYTICGIQNTRHVEPLIFSAKWRRRIVNPSCVSNFSRKHLTHVWIPMHVYGSNRRWCTLHCGGCCCCWWPHLCADVFDKTGRSLYANSPLNRTTSRRASNRCNIYWSNRALCIGSRALQVCAIFLCVVLCIKKPQIGQVLLEI